ATTATPVVYLTEEPVWTVDEKVKQWALDDSILWLQHTETAEMKWATVVEEAVQAAKEAEAKLLIVDTLPQWAQLRGETENHSGEMLAAVRPLQIAAQKHGLAVLILTHHRKSEGDYGTRIRGSGALPGAVDIILELERPKKREEDREGYRIVRTESRFKATPPELLIKLNPEGYVLVNDVRPADLASQAAITRQRILDAIAVRGTATVQQIIADTRLSRTTVDEHTKVLEEFEGKLEKASQAKPQAYRLRSTASVEISDQPDTNNTPSLSDSIAEAA